MVKKEGVMDNQSPAMTIGKLAEALNLNIETIRYYQREGLVKEPAKRSNGYRYYSMEHMSRIMFIIRAKELGFTLSEIKEIFQINTVKKATCLDVIPKVQEKIKEIDQKIKDLNKIKSSLKQLQGACEIGEEEMKKFSMMDCFMNECKC